MDEIDKLIEEAYEETNYSGADKIFKYLNKNHNEANITKEEIIDYLESQKQEQLLKQNKKPKAQGHIIAAFPGDMIQIDIYDLAKYEAYNKHYKYVFAAVDVFSRYAVAVPMKTKNIDDTTEALKKVILRSPWGKPETIMSDNDSSFLGGKFQDLLDDENITLNTNIKGDHLALGIIDNFARRFKLVMSKKFLKYDTKDWIQYLPEVLQRYNDLSNSSLNDLTPSEAIEDKNFNIIFELNAVKGVQNQTVSDLELGDKVRVKIGGIFTKSSEPQYSDKVYTVEEIKGNNITLSGGEMKKRYNLLKVPKATVSNDKNVITQVSDKARAKKLNIKAGVNKNNIIRQPIQHQVINNVPVEIRRSGRNNAGVHSDRLNI